MFFFFKLQLQLPQRVELMQVLGAEQAGHSVRWVPSKLLGSREAGVWAEALFMGAALRALPRRALRYFHKALPSQEALHLDLMETPLLLWEPRLEQHSEVSVLQVCDVKFDCEQSTKKPLYILL